MAIYHFHADIIKRSAGQSAVAAAAYRAGEKLYDKRMGITQNYTRKKDVVYTEIMLPENAPSAYMNRNILWNVVETSLKRKDAQLARQIEIALPVELNRQEQIEVMRAYVQKNFVDKGMCADFAIHDKGDGNPHAHILLTKYNVTPSGFTNKNDGWDSKPVFLSWRVDWARVCNEQLQAKGIDERIDHRTLEAQGIDREPTIHEGRNPGRIKENREIIRRNQNREGIRTVDGVAGYMHELKQGYVILDREISAIKQHAAESQREIRSLQLRVDRIIEQAEHIEKLQGMEAYERACTSFKRQHYVEPSEAMAEVRRLGYKAKDHQRAYERVQDRLAPLMEDREAYKLEYQRQKLLVEISGDKHQIQDRLKQLNPQGETTRERLARIQSERFLELVTEKNFRAILEQVTPEQRRLIVQRQRERARELGRER